MKTFRALLLGTALLASAGFAPNAAVRAATPGPYQRVLLLEIDGMHAIDLANWFRAPGMGNGNSPLRVLSQTGTVYMNAFTSAPSDEFPGMIAQVTGATPKSSGVYYIYGYDRKMFPPGSNCTGTPGLEVSFAKFIDNDSTRLDAGGTLGNPLSQINTAKLPMQDAPLHGVKQCSVVLPHNFLRVNTVFEEIHRQVPKSRTAWADVHPGYEILNGPSGKGVDDLFALEVNATANPGAGTDYTQSYADAQKYDAMKVQAVINEIDGMDSTGTTAVGVPLLFGMNFQSLSVGQRLPASGPDDKPGLIGGYKSSTGALNNAMSAQFSFIDSQIGLIRAELVRKGLLDSTLIIVSAKYGQNPINANLRFTVDPASIHTITKDAFDVADTAALIWLDPNTRTLSSYNTVLHSLDHYHTLSLHIATLLSKNDLAAQYNSPFKDSRVPDFIALPYLGVIYTTGTKLAEHGGFSDDDRKVALMVSGTALPSATNAEPVETRQIAPTILAALGLSYSNLQAVQQEGTQPLPLKLSKP